MSVINQMLKDLEQRNTESNTAQNGYIPAQNTSSKKGLFWAVLIIIIINVVGWLVWQLYSENQLLKNNNRSTTDASINTPNANTRKSDIEKLAEKEASSNHRNTASAAPRELSSSESTSLLPQQTSEKIQAAPEKKSSVNEQLSEALDSNEGAVDTAAQITSASADKEGEPVIAGHANSSTIKKIQQPAAKPAKISVSRRQLTTGELVDKKLVQAEKAIAASNISKAETLYEDILLLDPDNKHTRKQLAALWFGRQAYQPALNLLSQGLAIDPEDSEFRLMQARIYLTNENYPAALKVLKGHENSADKEYPVLLASVAQEVGDFKTAINAYEILLQLQPQNGRWWLGSAIAHDSSGDFSSAKEAYQQAISKNDLTKSSADFAVQRLLELGE